MSPRGRFCFRETNKGGGRARTESQTMSLKQVSHTLGRTHTHIHTESPTRQYQRYSPSLIPRTSSSNREARHRTARHGTTTAQSPWSITITRSCRGAGSTKNRQSKDAAPRVRKHKPARQTMQWSQNVLYDCAFSSSKARYTNRWWNWGWLDHHDMCTNRYCPWRYRFPRYHVHDTDVEGARFGYIVLSNDGGEDRLWREVRGRA